MGHALRDESFKSDTMYGGKERGIKRRGNGRRETNISGHHCFIFTMIFKLANLSQLALLEKNNAL